MIRTQIFFLLLQIAVFTIASAQKERNIWMSINGAGVRFNESVHTFDLSTSWDYWRTDASICDTNGELRFYYQWL
ncbi:MAG: hypothetical protein LH473_03560 [Chitinophagales bacterium]|nr:hypothetical protein [Chitinophagales bacterium]